MSDTESHPNREELLDLALETLEGERAAGLREHLTGCEDCADAYLLLEEEQGALKAALEGEPAAPAGLEEKVLAAVRAAPTPAPVRSFRWRRWLAVAAGALVATTAALYMHQEIVVPKRELIQQVRVSELKALGLEEVE